MVKVCFLLAITFFINKIKIAECLFTMKAIFENDRDLIR